MQPHRVRSMLSPLSTVLLAHVAEPARAALASDRGLEETLVELLGSARSAGRDVDVAPERFVQALGLRVPPDARAADALRALRVRDLWLVCAALDGDAQAISAIERECWPSAEGALAKLGAGQQEREEILQQLRSLLFVARPDAPAGIAGYGARGDLRAWVSVVAVRTAGKLRNKSGRERPADQGALAAMPDPLGSPEQRVLAARYHGVLAESFELAVRALPRAERLLLRQHVIDGLGIDALAVLYDVHRATAARRLARAKEVLVTEARRVLGVRFGLAESELASLAAILPSELEVSVERVLLATEGGGAEPATPSAGDGGRAGHR